VPDPAAAAPVASSLWDWLKLNVGALGFFISLILAIVKGAELYRARKDRSGDQQAKVNDAWFKTIVLDGAIPDLRQFLELHRGALKQAAATASKVVRPYMTVMLRYSPASEELKIRLQSVAELSTNAYATLTRALESLDDSVATFCAHADDASFNKETLEKEWRAVQRQFDCCFRDCLSVLRRLHFALYRGENPDHEIPALEIS
jgi:hypothetical protein